MRIIDFTFRRPEENLAFDEVLLNRAESGKAGEVIRFWETEIPFVVLGVSQILRQEVHEVNCREDRIPVMRRASAGGCVLQGPGCLNYSLILSHDDHPEIRTLRGSYCFILGRLCEALQQKGVAVHHKGVSDLAIGGKKVSGSAQKRRRRFILHHGTFLYSLDPEMMERYLKEPVDRPQYRGPRTHRGFLKTIPLSPTNLREAVCRAFQADWKPSRLNRHEIQETQDLAAEKYASFDWISRR